MGICLIKLKEPVRQHRLFQLLLRRRREFNFITCPQKLLDASPTSPTRLHNGFYEPFLSETTHCLRVGFVNERSR